MRLSAGSLALLILPALVMVGLEAALSGADLGLWGNKHWRGLAYGLGAFQTWLLQGEPPFYAGQGVAMFLTYAFLHGGALHLLGNLSGLAALGPAVARSYGAGWLGVMLLASTMAAAACYAILAPDQGPMVGASGAIFGLVGALVPGRVRQVWRVVAELVALNLVLWVLTQGQLAWQAHLGGFLTGAALALLARKSLRFGSGDSP